MKIIVFILCFSSSYLIAQEPLYDTFIYKMPIEKAKQLFKTKKKQFHSLSYGEKTNYVLRKTSLVSNKRDELISVSLWSKKNLKLEEAENYLKKSRSYLESKGFKTVYFQENWSKPLLLDKNKPGVRFIDAEKSVLVELESRGHGTDGNNYTIFITYYNYSWFLEQINNTLN